MSIIWDLSVFHMPLNFKYKLNILNWFWIHAIAEPGKMWIFIHHTTKMCACTVPQSLGGVVRFLCLGFPPGKAEGAGLGCWQFLTVWVVWVWCASCVWVCPRGRRRGPVWAADSSSLFGWCGCGALLVFGFATREGGGCWLGLLFEDLVEL